MILDDFKQKGALLEGHFVLSSGLHSPLYLQCALALQHPSDAKRYGEGIASQFDSEAIDTVASPAIGGLVIGFAVAQALGVRFIWTERENGVMTLRRGFTVSEGERILVVEDVITTGGSTRECIAALGGVQTLIEIDTCHMLMVSEPERLAEILIGRCRLYEQPRP